MRFWDAFSEAMGTSRQRRIGSREAEQLLDADSNDAAYPELSRLLAAAAAPPRPDELVDLHPAVAAFEAAGRDGSPSVAVAIRHRVVARSIFVRAAAGVAVVLFGGTALAAEAGALPRGAQQQVHDAFSGLGVPPPGDDPAPIDSASERITPTPAPSSGHYAATPDPPSAAVLELCRSWDARQKNPNKKPMKATALRALASAAGDAEHIAALCIPLLAADQVQTTSSAQPTVTATPSEAGNGKGHTKATPTPKPHKSK